MPRAYRPRISTTIRARKAARALGITGWHGHQFDNGKPGLIWMDAAGVHVITLAEAERLAAEKEGA
jgi:hypothetical protein